jgi:hypothetical protein
MNFFKIFNQELLRIKKKTRKVFLYSERDINKVKRLRFSSNYNLAENMISRVLEKQPENFYAMAEYAQLAHETENYSLASKLWDQLLTNNHLSSEEKNNYILMAAESFLANKQTEKVISLLSPLQDSFPESNLGLANCHLDTQELWFNDINHFFNHFSLNEVRPNNNDVSFYTSLTGSPKKYYDQSPKVSVIMSAFNAEKYLSFAAKSILAQSWRNLELIIVNDASTDLTLEIAKRLEAQDSRVKVINNSLNVGTYVCRNLALDISTGDYVTSQDSDDWAHPDRIHYQVENLLQSNRIANLTRSVRVFENGRFELTSWGTYLTDRCCVSFMINKDLAMPLFGYWDSVRVSGDVEYIDRVYAVLGKKSIEILPEPMVFQLRHGNSLTTAPLTMGIAGRVSPAREVYKYNYQTWHKKINKKNCRIPFPLHQRPFIAPKEIIDPPEK